MSQNEEPSGFLNTLEKVAYIEERTKGDGITYGEFGDLVVLDLDSGSKYYITRDKYYDRRPRWSPDGRSIAWTTKRTGSERLLRIQGVDYPFEIFIFDLMTSKSRHFSKDFDRRFHRTFSGAIEDLEYSFDGRGFFFREGLVFGDAMLYVPLSADTLTAVSGPPGTYWFFNLTIAPGHDVLALRVLKNKADRPGWCISNSSFSFLKEVPSHLKIGNWSSDGARLVALSDNILEYDRGSDSFQTTDLPWDPKKLFVEKCYYTQSGRLVFFGAEIQGYIGGDGAPITGAREVFVYDKETMILRQVTSDGLQKADLASCVVGTPWLNKQTTESLK